LRRRIGPQLIDMTAAAKTAYQRRCDVRVELEHLAWRADDLPLGVARRSEQFRYNWVRDLCTIRGPRNVSRCSAIPPCPFLLVLRPLRRLRRLPGDLLVGDRHRRQIEGFAPAAAMRDRRRDRPLSSRADCVDNPPRVELLKQTRGHSGELPGVGRQILVFRTPERSRGSILFSDRRHF
jgi:hypothetical protein